MNGKKLAYLAIPILLSLGLAIFFLWPAVRPYESYLAAVGNLTAPFESRPSVTTPRNETGNSTGLGTGKIMINVFSSPSALTIVDRWVAEYNAEENLGTVVVDYSENADRIAESYSSVGAFLSDQSADLLITGSVSAIPLHNDTIFMPISPQAVAIVYNVPGFPDVASGLKLDPQTLAEVLGGNITYWDDSRIVRLNPELTLPHEIIIVVHEAREGSASEMSYRYLSASNYSLSWQNSSLTATYPEDLSSLVRRTPNSIGYVEYSYAIQTRMTFAALQNSDGEFITPSGSSIGHAIQNGTVIDSDLHTWNFSNFDNDRPPLTAPTTLIGKLGNGSYPLVGFYYAAFANVATPANVNTTTSSILGEYTSSSSATKDFVGWIVSDKGQEMLEISQYESVYTLNEQLRTYLEKTLK